MARLRLQCDPPPEQVHRIVFVPFLPNGDCVLVASTDDPLRLPEGDVVEGEHYLDAAIRIPLESAGYRTQRFHPFALDGTCLYAWVDGDRYRGRRPHAEVDLVAAPPEEITARLRAAGRSDDAAAVAEAAASFRGQTDASYFADNLRMLERAYLLAETPEGGSGFGRDGVAWRRAREVVVEGLHRDGTFLDVGCANGLLMESVAAWAAERGRHIEPYGVDLAPGLIELARRRVPRWAGRLWVGNALDWLPPDERRFDYVHTLLDFVPVRRRRDMLAHQLEHLVTPGGRLLVSHYTGSGATETASTAEILEGLGFAVAGEARPRHPEFQQTAGTAWISG
jgi:2-polyprenyl-3-methyl-5-hydroxy-6-metoxy-1,4-benzoquinol methylase